MRRGDKGRVKGSEGRREENMEGGRGEGESKMGEEGNEGGCKIR